MENLQAKARGRKIGDIEFITSSWLNFTKQYTGLGKSLGKDVYMTEVHKIMKSVIADSKIYILCDPELEDNILSFAVVENVGFADVVHFIFTKKDFRGMGLGTQLVNIFKKKKRCIYTHKTQAKEKKTLLDDHYDFIEYNPFRFLNERYRSE